MYKLTPLTLNTLLALTEIRGWFEHSVECSTSSDASSCHGLLTTLTVDSVAYAYECLIACGHLTPADQAGRTVVLRYWAQAAARVEATHPPSPLSTEQSELCCHGPTADLEYLVVTKLWTDCEQNAFLIFSRQNEFFQLNDFFTSD